MRVCLAIWVSHERETWQTGAVTLARLPQWGMNLKVCLSPFASPPPYAFLATQSISQSCSAVIEYQDPSRAVSSSSFPSFSIPTYSLVYLFVCVCVWCLIRTGNEAAGLLLSSEQEQPLLLLLLSFSSFLLRTTDSSLLSSGSRCVELVTKLLGSLKGSGVEQAEVAAFTPMYKYISSWTYEVAKLKAQFIQKATFHISHDYGILVHYHYWCV